MTEHDTKPTGVIVTLRDIHRMVVEMRSELDRNYNLLATVNEQGETIAKLKAQVAALWVTHGIVVAVITARLVGAYT